MSPSEIIPIAIPETAAFKLTPPSIKANDPAHTVAIEEEPFDSKISDTIRMVYGESSGSTLLNDLWAKLAWPTSLLPGPLIGFVSPTESAGKL